MNCKKCGFLISNQDKFCPNCGEPNELYIEETVEPVAPVEATPVTPTEPVAPVTPVEPVSEPVAQPVSEPVAPVEATPVAQVVPAAPVEPTPEPTPVAPVTPEPAPAPAPVPVTIGETPVAPMAPAPKKNSNVGFIIIVIVLGLIIIGLGVFIAIKLLGNNTDNTRTTQNVVEPTNNNNNSSNNDNDVTPTKTSDDSSKPTTDDTKKSTDNSNTVVINGYTFTLPSGFTTFKQEGYTFVGNSNFFIVKEYCAITNDTTYDAVATNINQYVDELKANYPDLADFTITEEAYGNQKFLIFGGWTEVDGEPLYLEESITTLKDGSLFISLNFYATGYRSKAYTYLAKFVETGTFTGSYSFAPSSKIEGTFDVKSIKPNFKKSTKK